MPGVRGSHLWNHSWAGERLGQLTRHPSHGTHKHTHCSSSCLYKLLNICKKKMSTSSFKASAKSFQTTSHSKTCSDWWHQPAQTATPLAHFLLLWENFLEIASYFACPCLLLELWVCSVCCLSSSLPALSAVFRCCRKTCVPYRFFF